MKVVILGWIVGRTIVRADQPVLVRPPPDHEWIGLSPIAP